MNYIKSGNSCIVESVDSRGALGPGEWESIGQILVGEGSGNSFGEQTFLSQDGLTLAATSSSGTVRVYEYDTLTERWILRGSVLSLSVANGDSFHAALSGNGRVFAASSGAKSVQVFAHTTASGEWLQLGEDVEQQDPVRAIDLSSDGLTMAFSVGGSVSIFRYNSVGRWDLLGQAPSGTSFEDCVLLSANGDRLVVSTLSTTSIFSFSNNEWALSSSIPTPGKPKALSGDGKTLVIESPQNGLREVLVFRESSESVWEQIGATLSSQPVGTSSEVAVALSSDGRIVALSSGGVVSVLRFSE